jgi:hypothetical protein
VFFASAIISCSFLGNISKNCLSYDKISWSPTAFSVEIKIMYESSLFQNRRGHTPHLSIVIKEAKRASEKEKKGEECQPSS